MGSFQKNVPRGVGEEGRTDQPTWRRGNNSSHHRPAKRKQVIFESIVAVGKEKAETGGGDSPCS